MFQRLARRQPLVWIAFEDACHEICKAVVSEPCNFAEVYAFAKHFLVRIPRTVGLVKVPSRR